MATSSGKKVVNKNKHYEEQVKSKNLLFEQHKNQSGYVCEKIY